MIALSLTSIEIKTKITRISKIIGYSLGYLELMDSEFLGPYHAVVMSPAVRMQLLRVTDRLNGSISTITISFFANLR